MLLQAGVSTSIPRSISSLALRLSSPLFPQPALFIFFSASFMSHQPVHEWQLQSTAQCWRSEPCCFTDLYFYNLAAVVHPPLLSIHQSAVKPFPLLSSFFPSALFSLFSPYLANFSSILLFFVSFFSLPPTLTHPNTHTHILTLFHTSHHQARWDTSAGLLFLSSSPRTAMLLSHLPSSHTLKHTHMYERHRSVFCTLLLSHCQILFSSPLLCRRISLNFPHSPLEASPFMLACSSLLLLLLAVSSSNNCLPSSFPTLLWNWQVDIVSQKRALWRKSKIRGLD